MKFAITFILLVSVNSSFAATNFMCKVVKPESRDVAELSTSEPKFTVVHRSTDAAGEIIESREEIISTTKISKLKIDRASCSEAPATSEDGQNYVFQFACSAANGYLHYHPNRRDGAYYEEMDLGHSVTRVIIFKDCVEE